MRDGEELKSSKSEKEDEQKIKWREEVEKTRLFLANRALHKLKIATGARFDFSLPTILENYENFHRDCMPGGNLAFFSQDLSILPPTEKEDLKPLSLNLINTRLNSATKKLATFLKTVNIVLQRAKDELKNAEFAFTNHKHNTIKVIYSQFLAKAEAKIRDQEIEFNNIKIDLTFIVNLYREFQNFTKLTKEITDSSTIYLMNIEKEVSTFLFTPFENFMKENKILLDPSTISRWRKKVVKIIGNSNNENLIQNLSDINKKCEAQIKAFQNIANYLANFYNLFEKKTGELTSTVNNLQAPKFVSLYLVTIINEIKNKTKVCNEAYENVKKLIDHPIEIQNYVIKQLQYYQKIEDSQKEEAEENRSFHP